MSEEIVKVEQQMIAELRQSESMRAYLRTGDLSTLPEPEQDKVLVKMCAHYGLDPVLRPFCIIPAQGKKIWYATKSATDMVAARDRLSRRFKERRIDRELLICEVVIEITDGNRIEEGTAVVSIGEFGRDAKGGGIVEKPLSGEALANALMRCETKAKRRATLAWFGMPDGNGGEDVDVPMASANPTAKPAQVSAPDVIEHDPIQATTAANDAPAETAAKKRGRPSRAEIEAKSMTQAAAERPAETERVHFADQVDAISNLPIETPEASLASDNKPWWLMQKEKNPHFPQDFDPKTAGRIVGEPEDEYRARTGQSGAGLGHAIAEQIITEEKAAANASVQLVKYSREVDSHKAFMKSTLEQLGIDWKNPEHIKHATKISMAANGVAPIQDGAAFLAAEFQNWVSAELKKHLMPVATDEIPL